MSAMELVAWRDDLARNLRDWREPDGLLLPTEPDPAEREKCRNNLSVAIDVISRVLAGA